MAFRVKKLREFLLAKLIARILFVASGIGCVLLGICFLLECLKI